MPLNIFGSSKKEPAKQEVEKQPETLETLLERREKLDKKIKKLEQEAKRADWGLPPADRIKKWGHRSYIGGPDLETWFGIGKHQYHYLVSKGLRSHHRFLDIACGSLRLGQYLIPFLDEGHYFGLEGEEMLVRAGLEHEIMPEVLEIKKPSFAFNYEFDFSFVEGFDYAIAQSLFTHLTIEDIEKCFRNLRPKAGPDSTFFFTYFEGDSSDNPTESHAAKGWRYSVDELERAATAHGWAMNNIGGWGHARNQKIAFVKPA